MEASRRRRSIWWWFWTYFVLSTCNITLFSHVIIGIDHGREGVTATTPEWFVVRRRDVSRAQDNKSLGCCCRNSLPTVINPLNIVWQIQWVITDELHSTHYRLIANWTIRKKRICNSNNFLPTEICMGVSGVNNDVALMNLILSANAGINGVFNAWRIGFRFDE